MSEQQKHNHILRVIRNKANKPVHFKALLNMVGNFRSENNTGLYDNLMNELIKLDK